MGHTLKGIGMSLGISTNLEAVTAQYVDVRLERKKAVLETYHKALHPQKATPEKDAASKDTPKKTKKRSNIGHQCYGVSSNCRKRKALKT